MDKKQCSVNSEVVGGEPFIRFINILGLINLFSQVNWT